MALGDLFKLEKLKIHAYRDGSRTREHHVGSFEAMFNPTSFKQKYQVTYTRQQATGASGRTANYSYSNPTELKLKLILDGTGVTEMGVSLLTKQKSVSEQVDKFLRLTFHMHGEIHEPLFLEVEWGDMQFWGRPKFPCRLSTVDVSYTNFNRDGTALRAELDVTLLSDAEVEKRQRMQDTSSPDLTHSCIVKSGDTLPLLCKEIYGKSSYYLRVAQHNNLDNFRNLTPGQTLFFPPLAR